MKIFFRLLLAHLLTDFTFQTDFIARWKRKNFLGVVVHSLIFFIFGIFLLWHELGNIWFKLPGWVWMIILFILHMVEDESRAYNVRHFHTEDNILYFLWDQFIHIIFLYLSSPKNNFDFEPVILILCLIILGTHFTSVLVLYIENMFYSKEVAEKNFKFKYLYIFLRLITILLFLFPGQWRLISFITIPMFVLGHIKLKSLTTIGLIFNLVITYLIGYLVVVVSKL